MATVGLLPETMVTRIFDAVLASSIEIDALLPLLPEQIHGSLQHAREPQQRLAQALLSLNKHRTSDERPPIRTFLEWAARMTGPRPQGAVFREALSLLEEGMTTEQMPEAVRQRRPWYLGIVKRLYQQQGFAELPAGESVSPVFVAYQDMRARVVGIAVGDPYRILAAVLDHVRFMKHGAFRVEGHIIFPEGAPTIDEERAVLDVGLLPMRLEDLRRRAERCVRMRVAPSASGVTARQTAWTVERCKARCEMDTLGQLRDSTAERLRDLINEVRADRIHHVLVRASRTGLLGIASCALLTAWNEVIQAAQGKWPLYLVLERPFPVDLDDLLDRALSEQRVTTDRTVADSLFSDEDSVPVVCCGENVALSDTYHILHPLLDRKPHCIVLASEPGSRDMGPLFRAGVMFETVVSFPGDFEPLRRPVTTPDGPEGEKGEDGSLGSPGPLWTVGSAAALWTHPDSTVLVGIMKHYPSSAQLRSLAMSAGFDVSLVAFHQELERVAHDLVERAFSSDQLREIIKAMCDDPLIRHWKSEVLALLRRAR